MDLVSYQSVLGYFSSHYPPSVILAKDCSAERIVKLLKVSAGLSVPADGQKHRVSWESGLKVGVLFRTRSQACASKASPDSPDFTAEKAGVCATVCARPPGSFGLTFFIYLH